MELKTSRSPRKFYFLASFRAAVRTSSGTAMMMWARCSVCCLPLSDNWRHCTLSQIYEHMAPTGHTFKFDEAQMIATSRRKGTRLALESWLSDSKAVNRRIDLHPAYQALRHGRKNIKPTRSLSDDERTATKRSCNISQHQ